MRSTVERENKLERKVVSFINENNLLEGAEKVYVATSGGADSMALLNFMCEHAEQFGIEVGAVHVNHGIRGETADRDADFVAKFCKANGIEFILFDASRDGTEVPDDASEEWARQLRYDYFKRLASHSGVKIATAHTISDQAETFIFRVARGGSGLKGLRCIPVKRDYFIRPFLCINRSEVEELVAYYECGNITDETNLGDDYSRNRIRHYVIPELKRISDKADTNINKVCDRVSKAYEYIQKVAQKNIAGCKTERDGVYNISGFGNLDDIILEEMLLQICGNAGQFSEEHINILKQYVQYAYQLYVVSSNKSELNEHGMSSGTFSTSKTLANSQSQEIVTGAVYLSDDVYITVTSKYITVNKEINGLSKSRKVTTGFNKFGQFGYDVVVTKMTYDEYKTDCKSKFELCNYADADKLKLDGLMMRKRNDGDTFKPACRMRGKVVKFMRSIPYAEKYDVPVIEDIYTQQVIWVHGQGFTDGYTPSDDTVAVYKFESRNK